MKLYIINDYKSIYPQLKGSELTDRLIQMCLGDCTVYRQPGGKPFIADLSDSCFAENHISVSHTNEIFGLLVAGSNVGLDIQERRDVDAAKIAARFFSPKEAELVNMSDSTDEFFRLWTRKEAYAKYTGAGIKQVAAGTEVLQPEEVEFRDYMLDTANDCFCAICAQKGAELDEIQISYRK